MSERTSAAADFGVWRVWFHGAGFTDEKSHVDTWDQAVQLVLDRLTAHGPRVTQIELRKVDKP